MARKKRRPGNFDPDVGGGVDRDKIPAEDFAGRHRSFPVVSQSDVSDALQSIGRAGEDNYDAATLRRNIIAIARRKGFSVPGQDSDSKKAAAGNPYFPDGRSPAQERVSPSRVSGGAAASVSDHGGGVDPMAVPGARELAFRHPASRTAAGVSMDQGTSTPFPLFTTRTNADMFPADLRGMSNGIPVALSRLDAAAASGMPGPDANPVSRRMDHIAPTGVPGNGGHSLSQPLSNAPMAMKNSELRAEFKRMLFPGSGGGR